MNDSKRCLQCLVHLNAFEMYWAYFSLSDGKLYPAQCRKAAEALAQSLSELPESVHHQLDTAVLQVRPPVNTGEIINVFRAWHEESSEEIVDRFLKHSRALGAYFQALKHILSERLELPLPATRLDGSERLYRESFIRWQAHFPTLFLMKMARAPEILSKASASETIVVMGDIRRSQDLMTYARDSDSFISYTVKFIEHTRSLIDDSLGIFDKFTGDGFLAYFNESVCSMQEVDYKACFLDFIRKETEFAAEHFASWCRTVRKIPDVPIGLCIGADIGHVSFQDINSYFMTVGDPIVWAKRMADLGNSGETAVNNLLYAELKDTPGITFEPRQGRTKAGEPFLARIMRFES